MIEVKKEKLNELKIFFFDLTPTELYENDQLTVAGHPVSDDGVQYPLQISHHQCKKILGIIYITTYAWSFTIMCMYICTCVLLFKLQAPWCIINVIHIMVHQAPQ